MNVKLADLLVDKRQNYRIDGVDHLEFDPEWAEEGGWIILFTPIPHKIILGKCVAEMVYEYRHKTNVTDLEWETDPLGLRSYQEIVPEYMRMALPVECEQAHVRYQPKHSRDVMLRLADAQITGYIHADSGRNLSQLASEMGLTEQEWQLLMAQKESGAQLLRSDQKQEIDAYFKKQSEITQSSG